LIREGRHNVLLTQNPKQDGDLAKSCPATTLVVDDSHNVVLGDLPRSEKLRS
jgi:hypothetical protein